MPALKKALAEVTPEDLTEVLLLEWPEDEQLEFKRALPAAEGAQADRWVTHGDGIGDAAKRGLFKEVVAFANSYGGDLILGIEESDDNPKRASKRSPVAKCQDLAERLAMAARSLIDPQIPRLEVRGIPVDEMGNGYVVIRVPRSRMAPHRLTLTKECYRRRRDSTEAMTMREIQDLTFAVARGLDAVDRRLVELRTAFRAWAAFDQMPSGKKRFAMRVTGIPASSDLYIERVHNVAEIQPKQRAYHAKLGTDQEYELNPVCNVYNWRPVLRGTQATEGDLGERRRHLQLLSCDGTVVYQSCFEAERSEGREGHRPEFLLYPGWLFGLLLNALDAADRIRSFSAANRVEYVFELEIATTAPLPVMRMGTQWFDAAGTIATGEHSLPRYPVGDAETRHEMLNTAWRDFWNSIGVEPGEHKLNIVG